MNPIVRRKSGVLLHPTALPGKYGVGDIGLEAYKFVDHLYDMKQSLWQILPIGPNDYSNSPYSSISTFAGNHLLISLDLLVKDGLLDPVQNLIEFKTQKVDFNDVIKFKMPILKEVAQGFGIRASSIVQQEYEDFCIKNSYWLNDYSKYWALREVNAHKSWIDWNQNQSYNLDLAREAKIIQFIFHSQWNRLHEYCKDKGIEIIGDMPIYVSYNSADVYANQELFQLDKKGRMRYQGGCPPCEYQKEGQLWGVPLYDWKNHENSKFEWWHNRFKKLFEMVDIIRLDHFIGYAKYYRIPIADKTAEKGLWMESPGNKLFSTLSSNIKNFNVIAEDLGDITEEVVNLRDKYDFPGMRVLQFEFNQKQKKDFFKNSLVCTGTHDNNTIIGWFNSLPDDSQKEAVLTRNDLLNFFKCSKNNIHWEMINYALNTDSNVVVIPIQDLFGDDSYARFNTPGTLSDDNWSWRMEENQITDSIKNKFSQLSNISKRNT